jgi:Ca2+-binding EF-hand superfamily protein
MFDIDENGQISKHEFEEVFGGIEIDFVIWEDMLLKFDSNQNGAIEEEEFINLL